MVGAVGHPVTKSGDVAPTFSGELHLGADEVRCSGWVEDAVLGNPSTVLGEVGGRLLDLGGAFDCCHAGGNAELTVTVPPPARQ